MLPAQNHLSWSFKLLVTRPSLAKFSKDKTSESLNANASCFENEDARVLLSCLISAVSPKFPSASRAKMSSLYRTACHKHLFGLQSGYGDLRRPIVYKDHTKLLAAHNILLAPNRMLWCSNDRPHNCNELAPALVKRYRITNVRAPRKPGLQVISSIDYQNHHFCRFLL